MKPRECVRFSYSGRDSGVNPGRGGLPQEWCGVYDSRMHVALTDVLTCPGCGPGHELILLPDEVREGQVVSGVLGCADCREQYRIEGGVADLAGGRAAIGMTAEGGNRAGAERLGGLLGLGAGSGMVLLVGPGAAHAAELSALVEAVDVVATVAVAERGVSAIRVSEVLPIQSASLRGVALGAEAVEPLLEEGARVLAPGGRLLLEPAPEGARRRLEEAGLRVVAEHEGSVLAAR